MIQTNHLSISVTSELDARAIPLRQGERFLVEALLSSDFTPVEPADDVRLDMVSQVPPRTAVSEVLERRRRNASWEWDYERPSRSWLACGKYGVKLSRFAWGPSDADLVDALGSIPFGWMSVVTHDCWGGVGLPVEYTEGPGFGAGHYSHGWIAAIRGEIGHRQIVSRRFLEYQPWRLTRDEAHDISFIEFHDTDVDALTALEQTKPAHEAMGINRWHKNHDPGGFIQARNFQWWYPDLRKQYDPTRKQLIRVVPPRGRVDTREMLEACAHRRHQPLEQPIDSVAYVFMLEADARRHLHDLWLRDLEVRAIVGGREVRLDEDYEPPPHVPPAWVTGQPPRPDDVTTTRPVYDRTHDHSTIDALTLSEGPGYAPKQAPPEVTALIADLEGLHLALHAHVDRLHDRLDGAVEHDAAPPDVAAEIRAVRELLCETYRTAIMGRDEDGAAAATRAHLEELGRLR